MTESRLTQETIPALDIGANIPWIVILKWTRRENELGSSINKLTR